MGSESASLGTNPGAASKTASGLGAASAPDSASQTKDTKKDAGKSSTPPAQNQVDQLKKELDGLKAQQEGWKSSAQRYEQKLATETSDFRRTMYQDALDNDRRNVSLFQHKIDETESKLAGAEDAASKANAASGQPGGAPPH
jgi:chromosome segregation ATPase